MSRIAKWLIRLYPSAWRGRYGKELEALVEDSDAGWRDVSDVLKGAASIQSVRWPVILGSCAALGALVGFATSFLLPQLYVSSAFIAIRTPAGVAPAEALRATVQSAMTTQALMEIIHAQDLYSKDLRTKPAEDAVDTMRRYIRIAALPPANFEVAFAHEDRRKAQASTQLLVDRIMRAHVLTAFTLEVTKPAGLPDRSLNPYIFKGSVAGLLVGLLLGSILARVRRQHAMA